MTNKSKSKRRRRPSPYEQREELAAKGDLLGLLEQLQSVSQDMGLMSAGVQLTRCLKRRSRSIDDLSEDGFALGLELAVGLLARISHIVFEGLRLHDQSGRELSSLPSSIKPWADHAERLTRFICEIAGQRARIRHLGSLKRDEQNARKGLRVLQPMAEAEGQDGSGQGKSGEKWSGRRTA